MADVSPELEEWILENYRKGYSTRQLKDRLMDSGYDPTLVDTVLLQSRQQEQSRRTEPDQQREHRTPEAADQKEAQTHRRRDPTEQQPSTEPATGEGRGSATQPQKEEDSVAARGKEEDSLPGGQDRGEAVGDESQPLGGEPRKDTGFDADSDTEELDTDFDTDIDTGLGDESTTQKLWDGVTAVFSLVVKLFAFVWQAVKTVATFLFKHWKGIVILAVLGVGAWFIAAGGHTVVIDRLNQLFANLFSGSPLFGG